MRKRGRVEEVEEVDDSEEEEEVSPATEYVSLASQLAELAAAYKVDVTARRAECALDKVALLEYMDEQGLEYARVGTENIYVKVSTVATTGRSLCVGTIVDVVKELKTCDTALEAAVAAVANELHSEADKWAKTHDAPLPDVAQARVTSRGCTQRPLPPLSRPLTPAEELAEVLYTAVHAVHKPRRRKLELTKTTKRGARPVVIRDAAIAARAATCYTTMVAVSARAKELAGRRAECREGMAACEPALEEHMEDTHEDIVEPSADGNRNVVIGLESKPVKPKPLTLPEFSAMLDAVIGALPIPPTAPIRALIHTFGDLIVDGVVAAMESRLAAGRVMATKVVIRRGGGGGGKASVDDALDGDADDDDEEDNMFGV